MTELEELTCEIVRKHLASGKKLSYGWDNKGSYYTVQTGFFLNIRIGREIVEFNLPFRTVPIYGDFDDLWMEASTISGNRNTIERYKRESKIIRWLKMMR